MKLKQNSLQKVASAFRKRQLAALKRDLASGIKDLDSGKYQTYSESNVMQLAEDVSRHGRICYR